MQVSPVPYMKKKKKVAIDKFEKEYPGYESVFDLERDISEWVSGVELMSKEFTGTIKVVITYEEGDDK